MVGDFSSGASVDLAYFIPVIYRINIDISEPIIYFGANENNIVTQPNDLDENGKNAKTAYEIAYLVATMKSASITLVSKSLEWKPMDYELNYSIKVV
jgi:hypothetical protein